MFTWKEYLLIDHMFDVGRAAEGGFHGPLPAIGNRPLLLERSRGPLIWQKAAVPAMWSLLKKTPTYEAELGSLFSADIIGLPRVVVQKISRRRCGLSQ
jgi:hypothetical protein